MATKKFALDIFSLLGRINNKNSGDIYFALTAEERKGFAPLVVMQWLSGSNDEQQILKLNDNVNKYVFSLGKHPHLLMKLLQTASLGRQVRATWIPTKTTSKKNTLRDQVLAEYFDYSAAEIAALIVLPSSEEIVLMAEELGWQNEDVKKLKKELT